MLCDAVVQGSEEHEVEDTMRKFRVVRRCCEADNLYGDKTRDEMGRT